MLELGRIIDLDVNKNKKTKMTIFTFSQILSKREGLPQISFEHINNVKILPTSNVLRN